MNTVDRASVHTERVFDAVVGDDESHLIISRSIDFPGDGSRAEKPQGVEGVTDRYDRDHRDDDVVLATTAHRRQAWPQPP
jgi:hypothetical protein